VASEISYVEAHGTGTPLGDRTEFDALKEAFLTPDRSPGQICHIGSVKTNIGHLESAAGIAGVIKTVLALQHREIPPHLNIEAPDPALDIGAGPLAIPMELTPWSNDFAPQNHLLAGASSFGFGGTNAHAVLAKTPPVEVSPGEGYGAPSGELHRSRSVPIEAERPLHLLMLSARNDEALRALAQNYAAWLAAHPELPFTDICFTANTGRSHFEHRLALVAGSREEARERFDSADYMVGTAARERPRIAFLFTGQGSQYWAWADNSTRQSRSFAGPSMNAMPSCALWMSPCSISSIPRPKSRIPGCWIKPSTRNRPCSLWNMPWPSCGGPGV